MDCHCSERDCVQRLISMKYEYIHEAVLIYNALTESRFFFCEFDEKEIQKLN